MDEKRFRKLRILCKKATPGPWKFERGKHCYGILSENPRVWIVDDQLLSDENAEFIILARELIPEMINEIESLRKMFVSSSSRVLGRRVKRVAGI